MGDYFGNEYFGCDWFPEYFGPCVPGGVTPPGPGGSSNGSTLITLPYLIKPPDPVDDDVAIATALLRLR